MSLDAGNGVANTFHLEIDGETDSTTHFEPRKHYLRIDTISWYVNKQSTFWKDFIASGTLQIKVANDVFDIGLGTYKLDKGLKVAPIFNRPIIADRVYNGGDLTIQSSIGAIKKDTLFGKILKDLANSTVDVATGAIQAASITGPAAGLLDVSTSLTNNIKEILGQGKSKIEFANIEDTFQLSKLFGNENFVLIHRGSMIKKEDLKLTSDGEHKLNLLYKGKPLEDGVWLLLRITRVDKYSGVRPWFNKAREIRTEILKFMDAFDFGGISAEAAMAQLTPSEENPNNLASQIMELVAIIRNDFVLSFRDALIESAEFINLLKNARLAIQTKDAKEFYKRNDEFLKAIKTPKIPNNFIASTLKDEFKALKTFRDQALKVPTSSLENDDLWRSLRHTSMVSNIL
ncbi:MAG: hypothetical protein AB3N18_13360 [Allomuricauda sp.]